MCTFLLRDLVRPFKLRLIIFSTTSAFPRDDSPILAAYASAGITPSLRPCWRSQRRRRSGPELRHRLIALSSRLRQQAIRRSYISISYSSFIKRSFNISIRYSYGFAPFRVPKEVLPLFTTPEPIIQTATMNGDVGPVSGAKRLRQMLSDSSKTVVAPGVYDGITARLALAQGFDCLYMVRFGNRCFSAAYQPVMCDTFEAF